MLNKESIGNFVITCLVVGFFFGFDDGSPTFVFSYWFAHYLTIVLFVAVCLGIMLSFYSLAARHFNASFSFALWSYKFPFVLLSYKFPFVLRSYKQFPVGIIIGLLVTLLSAGQITFPLVGYVAVREHISRLGRKYTLLPEYEEGIIHVVGLSGFVLTVLVGNALRLSGVSSLTPFLDIVLYVTLFYLIPLPPFAGGKIFFASRPLYVFTLLFVVLSFSLMSLGFFFSLLLALVLALLLAVLYFFFVEQNR